MRTAAMMIMYLAINVPAAGADLAADAAQQGDIEIHVTLDATEQTGSASATVRIHAPREVVWSLVTNCAEALKIVPGLVGCQVLETAPDRSSQRIRHVLDYSWFIPKLTYEIRATYDKPRRVAVERVAGDLKTLKAEWNLTSDGDFTVAHYSVELAPGFWVPHWLVRVALKRDLPTMLRALRSRAEAAALKPP